MPLVHEQVLVCNLACLGMLLCTCDIPGSCTASSFHLFCACGCRELLGHLLGVLDCSHVSLAGVAPSTAMSLRKLQPANQPLAELLALSNCPQISCCSLEECMPIRFHQSCCTASMMISRVAVGINQLPAAISALIHRPVLHAVLCCGLFCKPGTVHAESIQVLNFFLTKHQAFVALSHIGSTAVR